MVRDKPTLLDRINDLAKGLKAASPKIGYSEVTDGHRVKKYVVHSLVLGDREVLVGPGGEIAALEKVLRELENLARHYKPSLLLPPDRKFPLWLNPEARAFASRATSANRGIYRFGKVVNFPAGKKPTREQIVFVATDEIEMFRYFPVDRSKYKDSAGYEVAMDWNRSMQFYIEERRLAPSVARGTLAGLNRELLRRLILDLFAPGTGDAIGTGGDILHALMSAIRL